MSTISYPHIDLTPEGVPFVAGTTIKVVEIALDRIAHNWDADEIQRQHPHLSLAQIHAALTYYHDHQTVMDQDIASRLDKVEEIAAGQPESVLRAKLRTRRESS